MTIVVGCLVDQHTAWSIINMCTRIFSKDFHAESSIDDLGGAWCCCVLMHWRDAGLGFLCSCKMWVLGGVIILVWQRMLWEERGVMVVQLEFSWWKERFKSIECKLEWSSEGNAWSKGFYPSTKVDFRIYSCIFCEDFRCFIGLIGAERLGWLHLKYQN